VSGPSAKFEPFEAWFTFEADEKGVLCSVRAKATVAEMYEAACTMMSAAIGGMERAAAEGRSEFADRLRAMRAAREVLWDLQPGCVVADRGR